MYSKDKKSGIYSDFEYLCRFLDIRAEKGINNFNM